MSGAAPRSAVSEVLWVWGLSFAAIVVATLLFPGQAKLVATVSFLYLPLTFMRRRDEDYRDYGVHLRAWRQDLKWLLIFCAVIAPIFTLGYWGFVQLLDHLPDAWGPYLSPFPRAHAFRPRLPFRFPEWLVDQLLVVALPEEFFYRGYLQTRLRDAWPRGRKVLGARLGPAFWCTALLFAVGHLAILRPWRLGVFLPALLFGWMREKTGSVLGATLLHAFCNLLALFLETAFFR
ncbi:MAG TPA: MXAN_2755 family glutamic-type intramembrane protease [Myxococcaceae bacterium]|nr:MXAN_2755 family glutamic-type intramembrane protease [Myxococcaceae bacterium]